MGSAAVREIRGKGPQAGTPAPPTPAPPGQGNEDLERELAEFAGGRPYDEARVIERTQAGFTQGVHGFYLAGLGLNLIHRHRLQTFAQIIEQNFPGISIRAAYYYMKFARAASALPNFKQFALASGGYSKALTMLEVCSGEEVQEFEATGAALGYSAEDLRLMSARQMRQALLRAREKEKASVRRATAQAAGELAELRDQVRDLTAQAPAETEADRALALIKAAEAKILEGFRLLAKVPRQVLQENELVRDLLLKKLEGLRGILLNQQTQAIAAVAEAIQGREGEDAD